MIKSAIFFESHEEHDEFMRLYRLGKSIEGQPVSQTEGIEIETENPFAVPGRPTPEDPPVIPLKTRTAVGRWCSQCETFTEGDEAIDYTGKVTSFTCPQCGYISHPTVTTHEVPV